MPTTNVIVVKALPLDFSKNDLYKNQEKFKQLGKYIKSIPDAFFLSNNFRSDRIVHFCTMISNKPYIVTFYGPELKYLGPSFFSAGHLLLRAQSHVKNPSSKEGKLTPGLRVKKGTFKSLLEERYKEGFSWYQIVQRKEKLFPKKIEKNQSILLLFGFEPNELDSSANITKISFGDIDIDEQIILANFYIFDKKSDLKWNYKK